ncbi:MAG TPA: DsbA family protein [Thermomicrobiales bacterium]|nr:DsbA family protein [Thermomicrobiales bacterium]
MSARKSPNADRREARRQARVAQEQKQLQNARRRRLITMISGVVAVAVIAVVILVIVNNLGKDDGSLENLPAAESIYGGVQSQGLTLGDPNAPVTVTEYADYQCPYCANFALKTEPKLIDDFVKTGKIKYVFRPMPILSPLPLDSDGNESVQAAEASMCANDQGKFWEFHHLLYTKQNGENVGIFSNANLINYAAEEGLDVTSFTSCLNTGKYQKAVLDSRAQGVKDGVSGTPSFDINGTVVTYTTQGYDKLKQQIQAAIDGESIPK